MFPGTLAQTPVAPAAAAAAPNDPNCDRILTSMADGCGQIRDRLLQQDIAQPQQVCCTLFRYNMAVQSVRAYATIAKATRICAEAAYDEKVAALEAPAALAPYRTACAAFPTQNCITEPATNAWNSAVATVQNTYNQMNVDQLGAQLGSNWNNAMSSLSNWANTVGASSLGSRLQAGATALQGQLTARTQALADAVSGQGANRYSLVNGAGDGDGAHKANNQGDSLSLDSIIHSVVPEVEIVETKPGGEPAKPETTGTTTGKRFSLMDWFGSMTQNIRLPGTGGGAVAAAADGGAKSGLQEVGEQVGRRNPYSVY